MRRERSVQDQGEEIKVYRCEEIRQEFLITISSLISLKDQEVNVPRTPRYYVHIHLYQGDLGFVELGFY